MKQYRLKPFLIVHSSFELGMAEALLGALDMSNQGKVTDILDADRIEQLLMHVEQLVSNEIQIKDLYVFADDEMHAANVAQPAFLQLIYETIMSFDVEIYFG